VADFRVLGAFPFSQIGVASAKETGMIRVDKLCIDLPGFSVKSVDLSVEKGEFFTLLGPTGAGKTLVLEAISGLAPVTTGRILVEDRDVTHTPPEQRGIGIVYQDYALFPHLNVLQNITYGIRYQNMDQKESQKRVHRFLEALNLGALRNRSVHNLSGGERQRVALARALVVSPSVLLLDEPLSALDPNFREDLRKVLKELHRDMGITFLMVTHDFGEALFLADRAAVINQGRIEQIGKTDEVFQRPSTPFVAEFVGMKNVFEADFQGDKALFGTLEIDLAEPVNGAKHFIAVRPEDVVISREALSSAAYLSFKGEIQRVVDNGPYYDVFIAVKDTVFQAFTTKSALIDTPLVSGQGVFLNMKRSHFHVF
jgi:molybdate/tungstate transport system ATP-binding protein